MKLIPEETRIQQINDLPNISFVRWLAPYKNNTSKAMVRCAVDGHEWPASVSNLTNHGSGCPKCAGNSRKTEQELADMIEQLPDTSFIRWGETGYRGNKTKAFVRCDLDGYEWSASADSLLNHGKGCPHCARKRRWTAEERIAQINALQNISFIRWEAGYKGANSKAVCRCAVDGFEWGVSISNLLNNGRGCPQCSGKRRWTAEERIAQINAKPNITFVRWASPYKNSHTKAFMRCDIDGYEWRAAIDSLLNAGAGCPQCSGVRKWTAEERIAQINEL
ncbi:MAG: zinc-ribbon domain-containing protein, partial [Aeromonadaceae bacterium]